MKKVSGMSFPEYIFKVCLFANKDVGKKSLAKSDFLYNPSNLDHMITTGVETASKTVGIYDEMIRLQLWILSPEERWRSALPLYIRGSGGVILMYDITNAKTLNWLSECIQMIKNVLDYDPPILLVGNKLDLEENREVSKEQVKNFKENNDISSSMEISLKSGENVNKMFMKFTRMILRRSKTDFRIGGKEPRIEKKRKKLKKKKKEKKGIK